MENNNNLSISLKKSEKVKSELKLSISELIKIEEEEAKEREFIEDFKYIKEKYSEVASNIVKDIQSSKKILKEYNNLKFGENNNSKFKLVEPYIAWYYTFKFAKWVFVGLNGMAFLTLFFDFKHTDDSFYFLIAGIVIYFLGAITDEIIKKRNQNYFENGPILLFNAIVLVNVYKKFYMDKEDFNKIHKKYVGRNKSSQLSKLHNDNIAEMDDFKLMVEQFNI